MADDRFLDEAGKKRVRQQILAAFEEVPMPKAGEIILKPSIDDQTNERRMRDAFAGKRWNDLSVEFVENQWSVFRHLSARAFQYYLPALLITSLDSPENDRDFDHSVLFELNPSANAIYYVGTDSHFELQTLWFDEDQFRAVAAYLGLFLYDEPDEMTFRAGKAFRWGWDRVETPERNAFGDFYHRMHHFQYPDPDDPANATLANDIRAAFADTPYPGDDNLSGTEQGDESAESALEFFGLDWRTIRPKLLASNYGSLALLTPSAFRYFLPAYLIADLTGVAGDSNAHPADYLTRWFRKPKDRPALETQIDYSAIRSILGGEFSDEELHEAITQRDEEALQYDWFAYSVERMLPFTRREREAIIRYLEHSAEGDEFSRDDIKEALDRYWRPSLEGAKS